MNLYIWIIYGSLIGIAAHVHDHRKTQGGIIPTVVFAAIGSVIGGFFANFFLAKTMIEFSPEGFILALMSAFILAIFYRVSFRNNGGYIRMLR